MRREFPAKVKVAAFGRCKGLCEECGARLTTGGFHYDHQVPDALGGHPVLDNCRVLCTACHGGKTSKTDVPQIAKAKRQHVKAIGAKSPPRSPLPGGRASKWRKKLDGSVVPR